jgi:protein required for attachment to host cells
MDKVWIVVCSKSRARVFETHGPTAAWALVQTLEHPSGRLHDGALATDREGQSSPLGGSVHHNALAPKTAPKEVDAEHFVRAVGALLERALPSNGGAHLVLVAPPHILGMLRKELSGALTKQVLATVDKDLDHLGRDALAEALRASIPFPLVERDVRPTDETHRRGADGTVRAHR